MADSSRTIMTDAGFALETRVRADETKMQFTRAAISTDDHFSDTDDALAKLTELYNIQQDGKVTAVQVINTTTVYVQVDVNQAESKADYQMRSAALYAKDDDGTEVLYGVTVLQDPVFVHKDADGSYLGFGINTTVGKASNVVVVVDPANMVTQQVFEGTMKNYYTKAEVDAKFVTDDDFASKLPNNIATTDAANTFAKSQTLAGGATDGKGNAYATTKDVATGLNNGLSTKVTDNHDGTEQLNGVQVQPYNKLSDVTSLRNIALQTDNVIPYTAKGGAGEVMKAFPLYSGFSSLPSGTQIYYSYDLVVTNADGGTQWLNWTSPWSNFAGSKSITTDGIHHFQGTAIIPDKDIVSGQTISSTVDNSHATYQITNLMIVVGSIPVTHLPAPEDKADDSKVVHKTGDEEISGSKTFDTAPIDKATGNPYITKSDVTTAINAATANVVDRNPDTGVVSKPTDFTNLTVNGGKSVATRDDLKSIEDASWHTITGKSDSLSAYTCMYRKNNEQKYVDLVLYGTMGITVDTSDSYTELLDLSEIISAPNKAKGGIVCPLSAATGGGVSGSVSISGTKLLFSWNTNNTLLYTGRPIISVGNDLNSPFLRVTFD
ncbi:hypothetical protein [Levilactobacillus brevis]|uniref:hypothetical protein n=1 Tax=Levilactobacillus brevis TaxID=1580 RepID=UPI0021A8C157|nr:hypothetical protein [Levilactobacillus brevis]